MPALTDEWLEEQLKLCKEATVGPWYTERWPDQVDRCSMAVITGAYADKYYVVPAALSENAIFVAAAREGYPLTLQLLKETRAALGLVLEELDHMVMHNPECLCDEDCQEAARELLNRHDRLEDADASTTD